MFEKILFATTGSPECDSAARVAFDMARQYGSQLTLFHVLGIPGKAPWQVTSKNKVTVLQRLVEAYAAGTPHVNTKKLMDGTNYASPANLFQKTSPWRDYMVKVTGTQGWQLKLSLQMLVDPVDEVDNAIEAKEEALTD